MLNQYPYTNYHDLNQDWILKQMQDNTAHIDDVSKDVDKRIDDIKQQINSFEDEVNDKINSISYEGIKQYINEYFNQLMINATYDADTETITLQRGTLDG